MLRVKDDSNERRHQGTVFHTKNTFLLFSGDIKKRRHAPYKGQHTDIIGLGVLEFASALTCPWYDCSVDEIPQHVCLTGRLLA
jgi:hypothetical protein